MNAIFLLGMPGGSEMIIVLLVVLLLFGGSRLPQLAKGLGESMKEFKKGAAGGGDDEQEVAARRQLSPRGVAAGARARRAVIAKDETQLLISR
jgi:sec-independent protein translocase protein TatA